MEGDFIKIRESLLPLSWLYGCAVSLRNFCFDMGLLKSRAFHIPVIAVGNITVGGTGKTPHVEYLIRLLQEKFKVAVLSRGYKRKSSGFVLADSNTTARMIGDEPAQMKQKYPGVSVAVDKKRVHGIEQLIGDDQSLDVVLLDDAFQHRYVKPGINILLVDYHRLIIYDKLLPAGRLREPLKGKNRADIVIVTKCPRELKPMEYRVLTKAMNLYPYQQLFFTTLDYGSPVSIFDTGKTLELSMLKTKNVLLLTGIAQPRQMTEDLQPLCASLTSLSFPDHHAFKRKDVERINQAFAALPDSKCIITTEKDAARLLSIEGLSDAVRQQLYALPVFVSFIQKEQKERFDDFIQGYVMKNSRNSILTKGKDERKQNSDHAPAKEARPQTIRFINK